MIRGIQTKVGMSFFISYIANAFECVLECYEKGAYSFVDGALEEDRSLWNSIREKYEISNM